MGKTQGLTKEEVKQKIKEGKVNYNTDVKTKTIGQIIFTNFFTWFNFLNLAIAFIIFTVGSYKNMLFMGVVICNTVISTFQEIRSKRTVDKLSLLNEKKATVIRDGKIEEIDIHEIVLDDILKLKSGNQIVTDCKVVEGEVLVNESLITGESDAISKIKNSNLLSGSFVVSGSCYAKVIHVAKDNYAAKISSEAKYLKRVHSEIMFFINRIIKYISFAIVPVGILLFINQINLDGNTYQNAIVNVGAALIGMIPEGLVLLTSTVLALSVIRLAKYKVLVQELYCIENLARVDTICLDKTGTLTKGNMVVHKIIPLNLTNMSDITDALGLMSYHMEADNQTMEAIKRKYERKNDHKVIEIVPFSSERKWSGISFENESYVLGAPEIVLKDTSKIKNELENYAINNRVVLLAKSKKKLNKTLPNDLEIMALILIKDQIRKDAKETINYFKKQNVDLKIISGDNPITVANIAKEVGIENVNYIDMSKNKLPIDEICEKYNVFGRVKPDEKKALVLALKKYGHTVAMTGDGVNDVLALKEADCSVAMNSGSDAARNVSQLVLLDNNFSSMPRVVGEGRRSINNIQRSSSLFLCKTIYATLLALIFVFLNTNYPFIPIQLSLTSMVTIGIPSFVLALEPNNEKITGKILINVLQKSVPTALTIVFGIMLIYFIQNPLMLNFDQVSTLCVLITGTTGFMLLFYISKPFNKLRTALFVFVITLFVSVIIGFREFFSLTILTPHVFILLIILIMIQITVFGLLTNMCQKIFKQKNA